MNTEVTILMVIIVLVMGGFASVATAATTVFQDDFESDTAGASGDLDPVIGTGDVGGTWLITEAADVNLVQVRNDAGYQNPSGGTNVLRIDRPSSSGSGMAWAYGWNPNDTTCGVVQLDFDVYVPTNGTQVSYLVTDETSTVWTQQGPQVRFLGNGDIYYYRGWPQTDTGMNGVLDAWQHVTLSIDVVNSNFDLTVGSNTVNDLAFAENATKIGGFGFSNNNTPCNFLVDNVQLQIPTATHLDVVVLNEPGHSNNNVCQSVIDTLGAATSHTVIEMTDFDIPTVANADALLIPEGYNPEDKDTIRMVVDGGLDVFLGYSTGYEEFPEIVNESCKTYQYNPLNSYLTPVADHPITDGIYPNNFSHNSDIYARQTINPIDDRTVLLKSMAFTDTYSSNRFRGRQVRWSDYFGEHAILVASSFGSGQGRVAIYGARLGRQADGAIISGYERTLLINIVDWLAEVTGFDLPSPIVRSVPSIYGQWYDQSVPDYNDQSISIETVLSTSPLISGDVFIEFDLPAQAPLYCSIPVVITGIDLSEIPASISLISDSNLVENSYPVQVETILGQDQLVFIGSFSSLHNRARLSSQAIVSELIQVKVDSNNLLAELTGPDFHLLFADEANEPNGPNVPTLQMARIKDWDWHHTWDGLERNSYSSPLIRFSSSNWPLQELPPKANHERGLDFPTVSDGIVADFPVRVNLTIGKGSATVYRTGQIDVQRIETEGRIATFGFDRYQTSTSSVEETVSYDVPALSDSWVWAVKDDHYAVGGTLSVQNQMGESGLSPGLEREIQLDANTLVLTAETENLSDYEVSLTPWQVTASTISQINVSEVNDSNIVYLPAHDIHLRRLTKMRGQSVFYPLLAEPIEIYTDELPSLPDVNKWRITEANAVGFVIGTSLGDDFKLSLTDANVAAAMTAQDPCSEDPNVWRRLYVFYDGNDVGNEFTMTLEGIGNQYQPLVRIPLKVSVMASIPMGMFTYGPTWTLRSDIIPPEQYPKAIRDIALSNLDYVIHRAEEVPIGEEEPPSEFESRLKRYGLWWMPSLQHSGQVYYNSSNYGNSIGQAALQADYEAVMNLYGVEDNILAWYLTDEMAKDPEASKEYECANFLYDTAKAIDPSRAAINLIYHAETTIDMAATYLNTDIFSWDPYGWGNYPVYNTLYGARKVDAVWRQARDKPAWITVKSCGPGWYDGLDLWLDIRQQSSAAFRGNVDGINYFMYAHWASDWEANSWYTVIPGAKGPIATLRRQTLSEISEDITLLTTTEYLLSKYNGPDKAALTSSFDTAEEHAYYGRFWQSRVLLRSILESVAETPSLTSPILNTCYDIQYWGYNLDSDFDWDCDIDFVDFSILAYQWLNPEGYDFEDLKDLASDWLEVQDLCSIVTEITLFLDDFESDTAGCRPTATDLDPVIGAGDVSGSWKIDEAGG